MDISTGIKSAITIGRMLEMEPRKRVNVDISSEIKHSLDQMGQDIEQIKTNLEKKKPKVTLGDINDKLDQILLLLGSVRYYPVNDDAN